MYTLHLMFLFRTFNTNTNTNINTDFYCNITPASALTTYTYTHHTTTTTTPIVVSVSVGLLVDMSIFISTHQNYLDFDFPPSVIFFLPPSLRINGSYTYFPPPRDGPISVSKR